jgi:hypothetical protein
MQLQEWSSGIGKHMLKIEDGKSAVGNLRGELVRFYQHWKGGRSSVCPGRDTCALCASADPEERKSTGRFRINFITKANGAAPTAMIFEAGKRVYDQMVQINKDVPLEKAWVRISRTGTKQNTQILLSVLPGDSGMVTPEQEKQLLSIPLHDLSLSKEAEPADAADEDLPF